MIQERDLTSGQKSRYFYFPYEFTAGVCQHSSPNARNKQFTVSAGHYSDKICLFTSRCSNQFLSGHFFNETQHSERRSELQPQPPVSSAAEHRSPVSPRLSSRGLTQKAPGWIMPLGSPWGSSFSLNFRRLKEAQGKGVFADQSQNPDHLTTLKSFE